MPELRWILIAFGVALLVGIYLWGRRSGKSNEEFEASGTLARPEPSFAEPVYGPIEPTLEAADGPVEDLGDETPDSQTDSTDEGFAVGRTLEPDEPTLEVPTPRVSRDQRGPRIEPTFGDDTQTAELPVESETAPAALGAATPSSPSPAPTLSMSSTPPPRRIERRKIIALRLAAGPQRLSGAELRAALEAESLQHGKYDVFHRLDENGVAIFSVASMVEPGTFDLEAMSQQTYPGITLFAQLPGPFAGMLAFNELVACSRRLHAALGGTLQDERGVPLTVHRIERIRQEIREFEHRAASEAPAQR